MKPPIMLRSTRASGCMACDADLCGQGRRRCPSEQQCTRAADEQFDALVRRLLWALLAIIAAAATWAALS